MARFSINPFSRVNNDTGFGSNDNFGSRFINRDGTFNTRKEGMGFWSQYSSYSSLSRWQRVDVSFCLLQRAP